MSISPLAMKAKQVIEAAWEHGTSYDLASQAAFALESAQLLQSPEMAAEMEQLRRGTESNRVDGARLIRAEQRRAELEAVIRTHRADDQAEIERLRKQVAGLLEERHTTNEALSDAAEELRANRTRIAELERPAVERHRREVRESYRWLAGHAREDGDFEGETAVLQQLAEREALWAREDELAKEFAADPLATKPSVPAPSVEGSVDRLTRLFAPTQALREDTVEEPPMEAASASGEGTDE